MSQELQTHNNKKRKDIYYITECIDQPPLKRQRQSSNNNNNNNHKIKCKFCNIYYQDVQGLILIRNYCCNEIICVKCLKLKHNQPCPECNEIIYAYKYFNLLSRQEKILQTKYDNTPFMYHKFDNRTIIDFQNRLINSNNNLDLQMKQNNECVTFGISVTCFRASVNLKELQIYKRNYELSIQFLIKTYSPLQNTSIAKIITDYIVNNYYY